MKRPLTVLEQLQNRYLPPLVGFQVCVHFYKALTTKHTECFIRRFSGFLNDRFRDIMLRVVEDNPAFLNEENLLMDMIDS